MLIVGRGSITLTKPVHTGALHRLWQLLKTGGYTLIVARSVLNSKYEKEQN